MTQVQQTGILKDAVTAVVRDYIETTLKIYNQEGFTSLFQKHRATETIRQLKTEGMTWGGVTFKAEITDTPTARFMNQTIHFPDGGNFHQDEFIKAVQSWIAEMGRAMRDEPPVLVTKEVEGVKKYWLSGEWFKWLEITSGFSYMLGYDSFDAAIYHAKQVNFPEIPVGEISSIVSGKLEDNGNIPVEFFRTVRVPL